MGNIFTKKIETVGPIDLIKFSGKWYEVARFNSFFENEDINVTATYTLNEDKIRILNESYIFIEGCLFFVIKHKGK